MAIASDSALQNQRLKKQENSLSKIQKYEQVSVLLLALFIQSVAERLFTDCRQINYCKRPIR